MSYNEQAAYMKALEESGVSVIDARIIEGEDYIVGDALVCKPDEVAAW